MMDARQILVSAGVRAILGACALALPGLLLAACGQKGPLYMPTDPAAKGRATLPETLRPGLQTPPPAAPASAASAPAGAAR